MLSPNIYVIFLSIIEIKIFQDKEELVRDKQSKTKLKKAHTQELEL